ncbi:MAG: Mrp/NBP35 family ATP-binding protein [Candidatus Korarchaeum sp.]
MIPLTTVNRSELPDSLARIRRKIAVMSGKGGVGKTTVSVNMAAELAKRGHSVGLLDADLTGPNVPGAVGLLGSQLTVENDKIIPADGPLGIKVVSLGLMIGDEDAVIWRGPLKARAIKELVENVNWGDLDFLIVDLPPGTGDEPLSVMQLIPLDGIVIVTTPQRIALMDVRRAIRMAKVMNIRVLGLIENMSYFVCGNEKVRIFGEGGGRGLAEEEEVPFLGEIPMDPRVAELTDEGKPVTLEHSESPVAKAFSEIADLLLKQLG